MEGNEKVSKQHVKCHYVVKVIFNSVISTCQYFLLIDYSENNYFKSLIYN